MHHYGLHPESGRENELERLSGETCSWRNETYSAAPMKKLQTSNFKLQGNSKPQPPHAPDGIVGIGRWAELESDPWVLRDGDSGAQRHQFDLEERTARFGEAIIRFCKRIPRDAGNNRLIDQLVGSGTSVGANYREASERQSKKDFLCSISRCKKEAKEAK